MKRKNAAPEKVAAFKAAMGTFRAEAKKKKDAVKRGAPLGDFTNWLAEQYDMADRLVGDY